MSDYHLYKEKTKAQIEEWEADLKKLRAQAKQKDADEKIRLEERIGMLEQKLEKGKSRFEELKESGEEAWETMKGGLDEAWEDLSSAFKEAWGKF